MGGTTYSTSNRSYRSTTMGYDKATTDNMGAIFTQKKLQRAHEQMLPSNTCMDQYEIDVSNLVEILEFRTGIVFQSIYTSSGPDSKTIVKFR